MADIGKPLREEPLIVPEPVRTPVREPAPERKPEEVPA